MTKTLTEQWKKKRIKDGMYYVMADRYELGEYEPTIAECYCCKFNWDIVKEVLAPVPSYDEYKDLYDSNKQLMAHIKTCEQQIERLQEQLNESNEIIKKCSEYCSVGCYYDERDEEMALDSKTYLKKWGVK